MHLYFSSESHIHALRNALLLSGTHSAATCCNTCILGLTPLLSCVVVGSGSCAGLPSNRNVANTLEAVEVRVRCPCPLAISSLIAAVSLLQCHYMSHCVLRLFEVRARLLSHCHCH